MNGPIVAALIKARLRQGCTQVRLARAIGCSERAIFRWERRETVPSIDSVTDWANGLGYDLVLVKREAR